MTKLQGSGLHVWIRSRPVRLLCSHGSNFSRAASNGGAVRCPLGFGATKSGVDQGVVFWLRCISLRVSAGFTDLRSSEDHKNRRQRDEGRLVDRPSVAYVKETRQSKNYWEDCIAATGTLYALNYVFVAASATHISGPVRCHVKTWYIMMSSTRPCATNRSAELIYCAPAQRMTQSHPWTDPYVGRCVLMPEGIRRHISRELLLPGGTYSSSITARCRKYVHFNVKRRPNHQKLYGADSSKHHVAATSMIYDLNFVWRSGGPSHFWYM